MLMSWGPGTTASRGKIALQMTRDVCVTFLDSLKNPLFHYQKKFLIRCKFSNEILLKLKSEMPPFNCSNWCWQQHGPHRPASIDLAVNPIRCNKLTKNWCPSNTDPRERCEFFLSKRKCYKYTNSKLH